jgi:hypothetical protein
MATLGAALTSEKNSSRLSYITVGTFNAAFFTYTQTTSNYVTTGSLSAVVNPATGVAVTAGECPAGRVLRETGRKLYATAAYPGVSTYMVSVYDSVLGVNGFIDPNSTLFAIYNVDKPNFIDAASTEQASFGPPVYTGSTVTARGNITSTNGNVAATVGSVSAGTTVTAGTGITSTTGNIIAAAGNVSAVGSTSDVTAGRNVTANNNLNVVLGGLVLQNKTAASGSYTGTGTFGATTTTHTITTAAALTNSVVLLTGITTLGFLRVTTPHNGNSFTVTSSATESGGTFFWFIIN